jgi:DnaJ-class molecular chaperone
VVRFSVQTDESVRREGLNIITRHYVTLTEALLGCSIVVSTVADGAAQPQTITLKSGVPHSGYRHTLSNKGIHGQGDHIAEIDILIPQNLD